MVDDSEFNDLINKYNELLRRVDALERRMDKLPEQNDNRQLFLNSRPIPKPSVHDGKRDTTKYIFGGKMYNKRRIVLGIIKSVVSDGRAGSIEELREMFPERLQGSLGVILPVEDAKRYGDAHKRFFFDEEDVIHLNGKNYVVCKEWDAKNIGKFVNVARNLGYNIQTINSK